MAEPRNLEQILAQAAAQPALRELLLGDREAAARDLELSDSERQVLMAVPDAQLAAVLDFLAARGDEEVPTEPQAAATGARPDLPLQVLGVRPDVQTRGIRPDFPSQGIRPDSPVKEIRPGRVLLTAAAAATVVTAGAATVCVTAGVRPDVPPPPLTDTVQSEDHVRQDAGKPPDAGLPSPHHEEAPREEEPEE